jgi:hypothetical protein
VVHLPYVADEGDQAFSESHEYADQVVHKEVGNLRVKPFELSPFRVKPRPRSNHTHFRQGLNSKKETQLGKFELSPVKKEGLNSKSLKIFDVRVKPRHHNLPGNSSHTSRLN